MKIKIFLTIVLFLFLLFQVQTTQLEKQNEVNAHAKNAITKLDKHTEFCEQKFVDLYKMIAEQNKKIYELQVQTTQLEEQLESRKNTALLNRGVTPEKQKMRVTAYDLSYESCGKHPNHPLYGITASGEYVKEWYTIAAGPELPFETVVYIPYFKNKPNHGVFIVKDRGNGIKNGCIDVYIADNKACSNFGVQYLDVWILNIGGAENA